jgi:hypothetical protein
MDAKAIRLSSLVTSTSAFLFPLLPHIAGMFVFMR